MTSARWLTYAQLVRLPNIFTAFADIFMTGAISGSLREQPLGLALILLASGSLYLSGMVWNDLFDREEDAQARPFRPIPSGRVSIRTARILAGGLMFLGVGSAVAAGAIAAPSTGGLRQSGVIALSLAAAILLYDRILKRTRLGPVGMGFCRFLNVCLGFSIVSDAAVSDEMALHLATVVGIYIVGVTWFARTEEAESQRGQLLAASGVMLLAIGLALALPLHVPLGRSSALFPYALVLASFFVGVPLANAIRQPTPQLVQAAVKRSIFGLVFLDAVLAVAFVGWPGLLLVLLLFPAIWLGKKVYST